MRKIVLLSLLVLSLLLFIGCDKTTEPDESTTLDVDSTPQGATIILDGDPVRLVTPAIIEIDPGYHEIRLELENYYYYYETFNVSEGDTYTINATMDAYETTAGLILDTYPIGAYVYLNGTYLGLTTPCYISESSGIIGPGYQHIRLYLAGYNEINVYFLYEQGYIHMFNDVFELPVPPYPVFDITYPENGQSFDDNVIYVQADVELSNGSSFTGDSAILTLNGFDYEIDVYYGYIDVDVSITAGENTIQLRANSENGDTGVSNIITVYGDFTAPEIEVVLWWNTATSDLDLHAWNPLGEHCYWENMVISDGSLDIDDTEGYGPETFAVQTANVGIYDIEINCYDLDEDAFSDATVQVFFDGVLEETFGPHHFIVDDGMGSNPLAWWEVCTIEVTGRGEVSITNKPLSPEMREKIMYDRMNLPRK